ncbi:hypothetical protein [Actinomyces gaoshouyii]|uniref:hypothetical protein n=1 Tax=Actinomyces gaoshouyii TaxID=1960083 RepID=UPI0013DE6C26|nr:hypothetical protein [Actinomyces gaoshouyii]
MPWLFRWPESRRGVYWPAPSELIGPWAVAAALIAWTVALFAAAIVLFRGRDI